jgi:hypothetical protein
MVLKIFEIWGKEDNPGLSRELEGIISVSSQQA